MHAFAMISRIRSPATVLSIGTGSALLCFLYNRFQPSRNARDIPGATVGHESSYAMSIMNPRNQELFQHRLILKIPAAKLRAGITEKEVLALFTKGFFGGWIFTPERWLFILTGISFANFEGRQPVQPGTGRHNKRLAKTDRTHCDIGINLTSKPAEPPAQEIWKTSSLSPKSIPPLGSLLFGNFLLADSTSATSHQQQKDLFASKPPSRPPQGTEFAEFVAGGSVWVELVSSHRFEVARGLHSGKDQGNDEEDMLQVTFSHASGNSRSGRRYSRPFQWLHLVYARLLFADGIREILKG